MSEYSDVEDITRGDLEESSDTEWDERKKDSSHVSANFWAQVGSIPEASFDDGRKTSNDNNSEVSSLLASSSVEEEERKQPKFTEILFRGAENPVDGFSRILSGFFHVVNGRDGAQNFSETKNSPERSGAETTGRARVFGGRMSKRWPAVILVAILIMHGDRDDRCCHALSLFSRRTWLDRQAVAAAVLGGGVGIFSNPNGASSAVSSEDKFRFLPPSGDKPQINLPTKLAPDQPLVQGLVYFANPSQERPPPDAVIVLTVRDISDPDTILCAAQIPLNSQRLPLQFQFPNNKNNDNLSLTNSNDLMVEAQVCVPENVNRVTKSCTKSIMIGSGLAKALQLPSPDEPTKVVNFRAGVSIALKYPNPQQ